VSLEETGEYTFKFEDTFTAAKGEDVHCRFAHISPS
jgi:hypothetical protein